MRHLTLIVTLLLFSGCSPRYVVKTHYTNPTGKGAQVCLNNCETRRALCQSQCDQQYNQCLIKAEENAKDSFTILLSGYDRELEEYYYQMDKYNREYQRWQDREYRLKDDKKYYQSRCSDDKKKDSKNRPISYSCQKVKDIKSELRRLSQDRPYRPYKPTKPTLDEEIQKFQEECTRKCGCTDGYDKCFISCGGKLQYEKICVENCN